ncbi:hypothetical protein [Tenacibaculum sp.]|uniref:hypothetical protein n=1 Tax=Tenacibaculum sp. TaxID=1906242 RepID=UPI003D0E637A
MVVEYKGHTIEVEKEKCLGGWSQVYYSVIRNSDSLECICDFTSGSEKIKTVVNMLKDRIDEELKEKLPWGEEE